MAGLLGYLPGENDGLLGMPSPQSGGLMSNPLFNMGLGILAASGQPGATFGGALGRGGLLGMQNLQAAQQAAAQNQMRQIQFAELKRKEDARTKLASALQSASQPQTIPGFEGTQITGFSDQFDPGVMAMPGSVPAPRAQVSNIAHQLSQPQTVTPSQSDILSNPAVRSALLELDPTSALTMFTKESAAPKVETAFDASGHETRMMWDPTQRKFVPLGGSKTDILSSDAEAQKARIAAAGKTDLTVNTGDKGLANLDVKTIGDAESAYRKSRSMLPDIDRMEAAVRQFPTGMAGSQVLGFQQAMKRLGWDIPGTSEGEIIQAIQSRLAPAMRQPGSGSSSDVDVQMFLDSLPNLFKTEGGNLKVIEQIRRITKRQGEEAAYMRKYFREHHNTLDGVYESMDRDLGPLFPRPKSAQEMSMLPKGAVFVAPDGSMRVKP